MKKKLLIPFLIVFFACNEHEQQGFAHIIQRRIEPGNKLIVSYKYTVGIKTFYDTLILPNRIIQKDSLPVVFAAENPMKHHLILP